MSDDIVGHKTFSTGDPLHPFRHEPLTKAEGDEIMKRVEASMQARAEAMPTEEDAVSAMWSAFQRLRELGWKEACYAPTGEQLRLIEPGSSGIHAGHADGEWPRKSFWLAEAGDLWPSHPVLWKPLAPILDTTER